MSIGLMVVLGFLAYTGLSRFYSNPDVSMVLKIGVSAAVLGAVIMIGSIIRERFFARKHERYEKEVER
jgi:hypothetical protein